MTSLLLADPSPALRYRALVDVEGVAPDDPEAAALRDEIAASAEVQRALAQRTNDTYGLAYTLCRLAYLRYSGPEIPEIAERIFELQRDDGAWPMPMDQRPPPKGKKKQPSVRPRREMWTMIPLQTSLPLRGLASVGYATDPRAERGYEWLLEQRLDDGAWPGDFKADLKAGGQIGGRTPGYRRLPRSTGCRSATTGALAAFALHPTRRTSDDAHLGLDHLLARETRDEWSLGWEVSRLVGLERARGQLTFYATFDLAFLLDIASRCGVSSKDVRVADLLAFLDDLRGPYGLWQHHAHPQLSRWLTLDLETSLARLTTDGWTGSEEHISVPNYPKRRRRF